MFCKQCGKATSRPECQYCWSCFRHMPRKPLVRHNFFGEWSSEMAYVLGLVITDGCVTKVQSIIFVNTDRELTDYFLQTLNGGSVSVVHDPRGKDCYRFTIYSRQMVADILTLGIGPHKSRTIQMPNVPLDLAADFLRGCWDGDGMIGTYGDHLSSRLFSGSYDFIKAVNSLICHLIARPTSLPMYVDHNCWHVSLATHDSMKLLSLLYQSGLGLSRKRLIFTDYLAAHPEWWTEHKIHAHHKLSAYLCECGCGQLTTQQGSIVNRYLPGHHNRMRHR